MLSFTAACSTHCNFLVNFPSFCTSVLMWFVYKSIPAHKVQCPFLACQTSWSLHELPFNPWILLHTPAISLMVLQILHLLQASTITMTLHCSWKFIHFQASFRFSNDSGHSRVNWPFTWVVFVNLTPNGHFSSSTFADDSAYAWTADQFRRQGAAIESQVWPVLSFPFDGNWLSTELL